MKSPLHILALVGMTSLFSATTMLANDITKPTRPAANVTGWVASPKATFEVSTYKNNDRLMVQVKNTAGRDLTVTIVDNDGDEMAFFPISSQEKQQAIRFDISGLDDGEYTINVGNRHETISKTLTITSQPKPARQAVIDVSR